MRRESWSPWIRYPSLALLYAVGVPAMKLLDKSGAFLRRAAKGKGRRGWGNFGDYKATPHDVFACVYFKSGTNWLMQIATQITHRGRAEFNHIHDLVPWPDAYDPTYAVPLSDDQAWKNSPTGLRVIKTHLKLDEVPFSPESRYICVVRDPKDMCVSSYHFMRRVGLGPMTPSVNTWMEFTFTPAFPFCRWADHLDSYWQVRHHENVLFMTYEEMKKDLPETVRRIAAFLKIELTPDEFAEVVRKSGFAYMKQIEKKFETGMVTPWSKPEGAMLRRGERGGSNELLTPEQQWRIDESWRGELKRLGCDFPYDEAFGLK
jgi:hypothetical protein